MQQKGSKRVMLRNVQEAKFKSVLQPIAGHMIAADERKDVASSRSSRTSSRTN